MCECDMGIIDRLRNASSLVEIRYLVREALSYEFASAKTLRRFIMIAKKRIKEFK